MSNCGAIDRETGFLLPPSVDEWLPQQHLARFVVEVVEGLDLRAMSGSYRGSGSASYPPRLLLGIVFYGYATGTFSSRKLERATYDPVAFRFIAANQHPDHDTIAAFRRGFLSDIKKLFVQVLHVAREMGRSYQAVDDVRDAVRAFVDRSNAQWLIAMNDYRSPNDARTAWDQGAFRLAACPLACLQLFRCSTLDSSAQSALDRGKIHFKSVAE